MVIIWSTFNGCILPNWGEKSVFSWRKCENWHKAHKAYIYKAPVAGPQKRIPLNQFLPFILLTYIHTDYCVCLSRTCWESFRKRLIVLIPLAPSNLIFLYRVPYFCMINRSDIAPLWYLKMSYEEVHPKFKPERFETWIKCFTLHCCEAEPLSLTTDSVHDKQFALIS